MSAGQVVVRARPPSDSPPLGAEGGWLGGLATGQSVRKGVVKIGAYIIRRLLHSILVIAGVSVFVFIITHMLGDPAKLMLPLEATQEEYLRFRREMGCDDPVYVQFYRFAADAIRGDFGISLWQRVPALQLVLERLPATFQLALSAMAVALTVSIPLGIIAAVRPRSIVDRAATLSSLTGVSVPAFWLGMIIILVFAVNLGWFPTSGYGEPNHLILPMLTLAALPLGRITQLVRSSMLDELAKQYMVTARSKGLTQRAAVIGHALKNAGVAIVTLVGWELTRMLAGFTVPVEMVFAWPGVGLLAMQAIERHDLPVVQAVVFVVALMVVAMNILVDIVYAFLDPRIRFA